MSCSGRCLCGAIRYQLSGEPEFVPSSGNAMRGFCADCGTGLFYRNAAVAPGLVDVQSATLDHPEALHVFGHNVGAQALYAKLGFRPTNINLFKTVGKTDS